MKKRKTFEIKFYEQLLEKKPDFTEVLISLGDAYTRRGFYAEGLEVDKKLIELKPLDAIVHYNFACSLSLTGEYGQSLKQLKKAISLGYDDFSYILEDPDLESLRKDPCFKSFLREVKARIKK